MNLSRSIRPCVLIALALCSAAQASEHDVIHLRVEAEAPGTTSDAYREALVNAKREAILQILETTLTADEFPLAKPLVAHPDAYVLSSDVAKRSRQSGATRVTVDLNVNETALKYDLAQLFLPRLGEEIRVLVLVAESLDGTPARVTNDGVAQFHLMARLAESGLRLIAPDNVIPHYAPDALAALAEAEPADLAELARENLADVIVAGTARVTVEHTGGANVLRNEARIDLRVVTAHDGALHGAYAMDSAVQSREVATGAAMAVEDAVSKVQRRVFIASAMAALRAEPRPGVVLTITGLNESEFGAFNDWLADRYGGEAVTPLHFAPTRARVRVAYEGSMGEFMDALTLHQFPGFRLDNRRAVGRNAELDVAGRGDAGANENGPDS